MALIDILLLIFFGIFFLMGTAKGALRSLLTFFSIAFSLVLSILLAAKFTSFFCDKIFDVRSYFSEGITNYISEHHAGTSMQIPSTVQELSLIFSQIGLPSFLSDIIAQPLFSLLPAYQGSFAAFLGENLAHIATLFLCGILLYILIRIAFHIIIVYTDRLFKTESVGIVSRFIGGALGLTKAYLYLLILFTLIGAFTSFPLLQSFKTQIQSSTTIAKWIYDRNFIAELLIQKIDFSSGACTFSVTTADKSQRTGWNGNSLYPRFPKISMRTTCLYTDGHTLLHYQIELQAPAPNFLPLCRTSSLLPDFIYNLSG